VLLKGASDVVRIASHSPLEEHGVDDGASEGKGRATGAAASVPPEAAAVTVTLTCPSSGRKRVGGQGDLLAGTLATFLGWAHAYGMSREQCAESSGDRDVNDRSHGSAEENGEEEQGMHASIWRPDRLQSPTVQG